VICHLLKNLDKLNITICDLLFVEKFEQVKITIDDLSFVEKIGQVKIHHL